MKKYVPVFFAVLIIVLNVFSVSSFAGLYLDNIADDGNIYGNYNSDTYIPYNMDGHKTVGALVSLTAPFVSTYIGCTSFGDDDGSFTISLYHWQGDYASTVASEPVCSTRWEDFRNNWLIGCEMKELQEEGLYYVELSDAEFTSGKGVGVWAGEAVDGQRVFVDGVYMEDMCIRMFIEFATTPPSWFGEMPEITEPSATMEPYTPETVSYEKEEKQTKQYTYITKNSGNSCGGVLSVSVLPLFTAAIFAFRKKQ